MLEYVLVGGIEDGLVGGLFGSGHEGDERRRRGRSAVPNTTNCSAMNPPNTFDLYSYEDVRNGGGREGNCSATIELDRIVPPSTDLKLCHLHGILGVSGYAQVPGSG